MTIVETVKQALTAMKGNQIFSSSDIHAIVNNNRIAPNDPNYRTIEQVSKALRSIPYVRKHGKGKYSVKGRGV